MSHKILLLLAGSFLVGATEALTETEKERCAAEFVQLAHDFDINVEWRDLNNAALSLGDQSLRLNITRVSDVVS